MSNQIRRFASYETGCSVHTGEAFAPLFGPSSCRAFEFPLALEQTILSVIPSAVFLFLAAIRFYSLRGSSIKVSANSLGAFKIVTTVTLAALQLALLVLWSIDPFYQTPASILSASLSLVTALAISFLSHTEHRRSIRPSALLNAYLLISLICDVIQARTLSFLENTDVIAALYTAGAGVKLILLVLEAQSKASVLRFPYRCLSPEETSGIFNRVFLWWINSVFAAGYHKLLTADDLPRLDHELASENTRASMQRAWDNRSKTKSKWALLFAITRCLRWPLASVIFPRTCLIALKFAQPFLISQTISFVGDTTTETHSKNIGYILVIAACFIYTGIAITTASYKHLLNRVSTILRGGMMGLIYSRSLSLQEGIKNDSAPITLMSTDVDTISDAVMTVHEIWAQLIEVIIGFYLLASKLGYVSIVPFLIIISCSRISTRIGTQISGRQKAWLGAQQKRVAITSSMLGSMKSLKMMGIESVVEEAVQDQRVREIGLSRRFRFMIVLLNMLGNSVPVLAPAATFIIYAGQAKLRGGEPLDTTLAFTSLAVLLLVSGPATRLVVIIPILASAKACLDRIQTFLLDSSQQDKRQKDGVLSHESNGSYSDFPQVQSSLINLTAAISINNLTVQLSPAEEPTLSNLNLRFETSSFTIVAGVVGSGKSTLLKAILGEVSYFGTISVSTSHMAYCAQTPWLQNGTIRQNICGFLEEADIDIAWYSIVLRACALDEDLALLSDGDESVVGSKGITLSGGQRQRVAIARAAYARLNIVLLDDVLSALDSITERQVVDRLLGPNGLFRKLGSTVVLVTHSSLHFHLADQIFVLGTDGAISQKGTYNMLRSQEGYIGNLLPESSHGSKDLYGAAVEEQTQKATKISTEPKVPNKPQKTGDFAIYRYWFKSVSVSHLLAFVGSAALFSFFRSFCEYWLKWWTEDGSHIGRYASIYGLLSILALAFESMSISWVLLFIGPRSGEKLHFTLLQAVMKAPQSFFSQTDIGVTLNRFSQDMNLIDRVLPVSAMNVVIRSLRILAQGILLFSAEKYMSGSIPLCFLALFVIQRVYLQTSRQLRLLDLESKSPVYTQFLETLSGLSTIRAFNREAQCIATSTLRLDASQRPYYLMLCIQCWLNLTLDLLVAGLAVLVIYLAVELRGSSTGGQIGIALNVVLTFNALLLRLVETWTGLETSLGAIARLKNFEAEVVPEDKPGECFEPGENWPEEGDVEFRNLSASYGRDIHALQNISLKITSGTKIGICGRTGSGKSSLLLTLLRLLDLDSGTIVIDGLDLAKIPRSTIRQRIIAIPQDPFFLPFSIRVNLDPSRTLPSSQLISALQKVGLWEIVEERGGLDGDGIGELSQGQQQLFCLARALLRRGRLVVLDEAMSSVDLETDRKIRRVLKEEFKDRTVIMVAHRVESLVQCDVVAVLDGGRLVEVGSPMDLGAQQGTMFKGLVDTT